MSRAEGVDIGTKGGLQFRDTRFLSRSHQASNDIAHLKAICENLETQRGDALESIEQLTIKVRQGRGGWQGGVVLGWKAVRVHDMIRVTFALTKPPWP